jgi:dimethylargininase
MPRDRDAAESFRFNTAVVCRVAASFADSSSFEHPVGGAPVDVARCRLELERLVELMRGSAGLDVVELPSDEQQPDGLFVGDIAVIVGGTALICNPPTFANRPSRHGEIAVVRQVLRKELGLKIVEVDNEKAIVEGGDVLWTGREIFVGLSTRTNMLGAQAVAKAFPEYSTNIVKVYPPAVHLKDYINVVKPEVLIVSKSPAAQRTFREIRDTGVSGYQYIEVEDDLAVNVIYANNSLIHLSNDQIPADAMVYASKLTCKQVGLRIEEILKRGGRLSSCVLLVGRTTRRTRRL